MNIKKVRMRFSIFWLKFAGKFYTGMAVLSICFMVLILGDLTGTLENGLLLRFIETMSPVFPAGDLTSYYYQALILGIWSPWSARVASPRASSSSFTPSSRYTSSICRSQSSMASTPARRCCCLGTPRRSAWRSASPEELWI